MNRDMSVDRAMAILGYSRSYIYKLVRQGHLDCTAMHPMKVSTASVLDQIGCRFPFVLKNCFTSLHYHVGQHVN